MQGRKGKRQHRPGDATRRLRPGTHPRHAGCQRAVYAKSDVSQPAARAAGSSYRRRERLCRRHAALCLKGTEVEVQPAQHAPLARQQGAGSKDRGRRQRCVFSAPSAQAACAPDSRALVCDLAPPAAGMQLHRALHSRAGGPASLLMQSSWHLAGRDSDPPATHQPAACPAPRVRQCLEHALQGIGLQAGPGRQPRCCHSRAGGGGRVQQGGRVACKLFLSPITGVLPRFNQRK